MKPNGYIGPVKAVLCALVCLASLASCAMVSRSRIVSFRGAGEEIPDVYLRGVSVQVAKDARAEPIRAESERLAVAILRSRGFLIAADDQEARYALSIIIKENEFVKGLYRMRSVLVEAVLTEGEGGPAVCQVRLERETENSIDSSMFLDEVLTKVLDSLAAEYSDLP